MKITGFKMTKKFITLLLLLTFFAKSYAQNKFNIDYNEVKGKLTKNDKFKKDFGRYHGFEFPLYEGETANFMVLSNEFDAKLVVVTPDGKVFKQSDKPINGFTSLITKIPVSGDYIVYVIGDQKDQGNFLLRYAVADINTATVPSNMDFCSTLNFLTAHANANFMMLEAAVGVNEGLPKLPGTISSAIGLNNGEFINIICNGNINYVSEQFNVYQNMLKNCLPDWKESKSRNGDSSFLKFISQENITIQLEESPSAKNKDVYELSLTISK